MRNSARLTGEDWDTTDQETWPKSHRQTMENMITESISLKLQKEQVHRTGTSHNLTQYWSTIAALCTWGEISCFEEMLKNLICPPELCRWVARKWNQDRSNIRSVRWTFPHCSTYSLQQPRGPPDFCDKWIISLIPENREPRTRASASSGAGF